MLLRIEANGMIPVPAPMRTAISYSKISSHAPPYGPSMNTRGRGLRIAGSTSRVAAFWSMPMTSDMVMSFATSRCSNLHPTEAAIELVKSLVQWM